VESRAGKWVGSSWKRGEVLVAGRLMATNGAEAH